MLGGKHSSGTQRRELRRQQRESKASATSRKAEGSREKCGKGHNAGSGLEQVQRKGTQVGTHCLYPSLFFFYRQAPSPFTIWLLSYKSPFFGLRSYSSDLHRTSSLTLLLTLLPVGQSSLSSSDFTVPIEYVLSRITNADV